MMSEFKAAMAKLAVLGQDVSKMVDCSELIPVPPTFNGPSVFPPSLTHNDIEQAVCTFYGLYAIQTAYKFDSVQLRLSQIFPLFRVQRYPSPLCMLRLSSNSMYIH